MDSITIPSSIISIGNEAFSGCSSLRKVVLEDATKTLSFGTSSSSQITFSDCPIESIYLGRDISYYYSPFGNKTTLTELTIGNSVTSIRDKAFSGCNSLTSVTIPNSVTWIGGSTFSDCSSLDSIAIPSNVTSIGSNAFNGCSGLKRVILEDGTKTLSFGTSSSSQTTFSGCPIESIYLGRNISYSGSDSPFREKTTLTELNIAYGITTIESSAFANCTGLTELILPESVENIGESAFADCSGLTDTVTIPNSVTDIGSLAFSGCSNLSSLIIGNGVTSMGNGLLAGCSSLTELILPFVGSKSDATGNNAMLGVLFGTTDNSNMQEVQQGSSTYYLPKNLKKISLTAPATKIADGALSNCTMLEELHIANTVVGLGKNALYSCNALRHIYSHWEYPPTAFNNSTFEAVNKFICTIHVPIGSKQYYSNADGWKEFNNITEDITSVRMINDDDNNLQAYIADGNMVVSGLKRGENIYIYNLRGVCIYTRIIENETEHINVEYLPTDVYVVKTGKKSAKLRL